MATTAIVFDLGDTLVEYEGIPLNWEAHYPQALACLAKFLGDPITSKQITAGSEILKSFNTRLNPRIEEISFQTIFNSLCDSLGLHPNKDILLAARAFFETFRQRLRLFPDTLLFLEKLRAKKIAVGIFTDAPYGMPRELISEDVSAVGIAEYFDVLLSSTDVGFRKPSPITLQKISDYLKCKCDEMIYIGNEQKDVQVAKAFGCRSLLIDRERKFPKWGQSETIHSFAECDLDSLLAIDCFLVAK